MSLGKFNIRGIRIAIDGFSSTGKSTLARELAAQLSYRYIDTGAMYRALTLWSIKEGFFKDEGLNEQALTASLEKVHLDFRLVVDGKQHIHLNDLDVEREIRGPEVASKVSFVAKVSAVRRFLVAQQQAIAAAGQVVMDGRDIASVVMPDAELKIFMTAEAEIRAKRRFEELRSQGQEVSLDEVKQNLAERDYLDQNRADSPLLQVKDARVLDNSEMTRAEQLSLVLKWAKEAGA